MRCVVFLPIWRCRKAERYILSLWGDADLVTLNSLIDSLIWMAGRNYNRHIYILTEDRVMRCVTMANYTVKIDQTINTNHATKIFIDNVMDGSIVSEAPSFIEGWQIDLENYQWRHRIVSLAGTPPVMTYMLPFVGELEDDKIKIYYQLYSGGWRYSESPKKYRSLTIREEER